MSGNVDESRRLLQEMRQGSTAAFETFYERFVPFMYRIALQMTGSRMDAEDICHDVMMELIRNPEQYDPSRGSVEAWIAVKTRSRSLDVLRRKRIRQSDPLSESYGSVHPAPPPEAQVLALAEKETVAAALRNVPKLQREALYGAYYEALTHRELAERMNKPLGTVKSFIRYGLNNFRKQLAQLGWLEPGGDGNDGRI